MNSNNFRVIAPPLHYKKLSEQFQRDMLESAQEVRNVLYNIPQAIGLQKVLMVLDFPHFIPIENTDDDMYSEFTRLRELAWEMPIDTLERELYMGQRHDVEAELDRRGYFTSNDDIEQQLWDTAKVAEDMNQNREIFGNCNCCNAPLHHNDVEWFGHYYCDIFCVEETAGE